MIQYPIEHPYCAGVLCCFYIVATDLYIKILMTCDAPVLCRHICPVTLEYLSRYPVGIPEWLLQGSSAVIVLKQGQLLLSMCNHVDNIWQLLNCFKSIYVFALCTFIVYELAKHEGITFHVWTYVVVPLNCVCFCLCVD